MRSMTNSVFIHESALFRRTDFTYEDVNAQYPPKWDHQNLTADGILKSFDKVFDKGTSLPQSNKLF